jgi:beta-lactam-binding protein with PASTA domain
MSAREQFERFLRVTFLVFILAAAGFLSALTTVRIAIRGRLLTMPNITGKPVDDAQRILDHDHLELRIADRQYGTTPANTVLRQSPAPGEQVKVSQDVQVIVSLGPQNITVPSLEGRSLRAAQISLLEAGLPLGSVSTVIMPDADTGTVVQQSPPPGRMATSPRVDVLVAGDEPVAAYVMPSVVGLPQADAQRLLTSAGLHTPKIDEVMDATQPKGTITSQLPPRGSKVTTDMMIELSVAE